MAAILLTGTAAAAITETSTNSYLISDKDDLLAFKAHYDALTTANKRNSSYTIDSGFTTVDLKDDTWEPVLNFRGKFEGNNIVIQNLTIEKNADRYVGFFGTTRDNASIKNMTFVNATITGKNLTGILIGDHGGNLTVENCHASGTVTTAENYAGGLIGSADYDSNANGGLWIKNCTTNVEVKAGTTHAGGIAGNLVGSKPKVINCQTFGNVTALSSYAGGIAGETGAEINNCSAAGNIKGYNYVGGIAGGTRSVIYWVDPGPQPVTVPPKIINCYSTGDITAEGTDAGGLVGRYYHTATNSQGDISYSYATGNVTAAGAAAGLVGNALHNVTIRKSFALNEFVNGSAVNRTVWTTDSNVIRSDLFAWEGIETNGTFGTEPSYVTLVRSVKIWDIFDNVKSGWYDAGWSDTEWKINDGNENYKLPIHFHEEFRDSGVDASHLIPFVIDTPAIDQSGANAEADFIVYWIGESEMSWDKKLAYSLTNDPLTATVIPASFKIMVGNGDVYNSSIDTTGFSEGDTYYVWGMTYDSVLDMTFFSDPATFIIGSGGSGNNNEKGNSGSSKNNAVVVEKEENMGQPEDESEQEIEEGYEELEENVPTLPESSVSWLFIFFIIGIAIAVYCFNERREQEEDQS
ncbi:GLUG motif-containing protein [Methanimicrococcus stummii]|nr:GLUG motif-containing protein [Methanimicrococcus sp. Es2]